MNNAAGLTEGQYYISHPGRLAEGMVMTTFMFIAIMYRTIPGAVEDESIELCDPCLLAQRNPSALELKQMIAKINNPIPPSHLSCLNSMLASMQRYLVKTPLDRYASELCT